jgi:hypothetical protein
VIDGNSCIVWDISDLIKLSQGKLVFQEAGTESMETVLGAHLVHDISVSQQSFILFLGLKMSPGRRSFSQLIFFGKPAFPGLFILLTVLTVRSSVRCEANNSPCVLGSLSNLKAPKIGSTTLKLEIASGVGPCCKPCLRFPLVI